MTEEEASQIKEYMKSVVDYGTASVLSGTELYGSRKDRYRRIQFG